MPPEAEALKASIKEIIDLVRDMVARGRKLDPKVKRALADFLLRASDKYAQLISQQEQTPQPGAPIESAQPELPTAEYPSSNINGFFYDPKNQKLKIQFHGPYPQAAGPVYEYDQVPPFIFEVLRRGAVGPKTSGKNRYHAWHRGVTPSHGAAVNALIKAGGFNFRKMS